MSTEMMVLSATGGLALLLTLLQGTRNVLVLGLARAAGNQHDIPAWQGWHDRLNRALRNLMEAVVIFAPIAVAVEITGSGSAGTALGASLFLAARVAHPICTSWVSTTCVPWRGRSGLRAS